MCKEYVKSQAGESLRGAVCACKGGAKGGVRISRAAVLALTTYIPHLHIHLAHKITQKLIEWQHSFQTNQRAVPVSGGQILHFHFDQFTGAQFFGHTCAGEEGRAKSVQEQ